MNCLPPDAVRHLSVRALVLFFFFFNDTATTEIYTLSLHDALPIPDRGGGARRGERAALGRGGAPRPVLQPRSVESDRLHHRWQRGRKRGRAALPQVRSDGDPRARTGGRAGRRADREPRQRRRRAVGPRSGGVVRRLGG